MATAQAALNSLEKTIAKVAGVPVEITIRAERSFTFSMDERNDEAADKVAAYFGSDAGVSIEHDDECGSFIFVEV